MRKLKVLSVMLLALVMIGCDSSKSQKSNAPDAPDAFVIKAPSISETNFGEARDIYIEGTMASWVTRPGNVRIELFKGTQVEGEPLRVIQSSVDPTTGLTPVSALYLDYPNGQKKGDKNLVMVPDIVREPGGFLYPGNKVVVTKDHFAGIILGGVTQDFDTDYRDAQGQPLADLVAGTYTLRVRGLSGEVAGTEWTMQITFGHNHKLLGRFKPKEQMDRLVAHAREQGCASFWTPFPVITGPVTMAMRSRPAGAPITPWRWSISPRASITVPRSTPSTMSSSTMSRPGARRNPSKWPISSPMVS